MPPPLARKRSFSSPALTPSHHRHRRHRQQTFLPSLPSVRPCERYRARLALTVFSSFSPCSSPSRIIGIIGGIISDFRRDIVSPRNVAYLSLQELLQDIVFGWDILALALGPLSRFLGVSLTLVLFFAFPVSGIVIKNAVGPFVTFQRNLFGVLLLFLPLLLRLFMRDLLNI